MRKKLLAASLLALLCLGAISQVLAEPVTGAIFTTDSTCQTVNGNIYADKGDVYLDGGPAKLGAAGLPDGNYYVQVTQPDGLLLGSSLVPVVEVVNGEFVQCYQLAAILWTASDAFATRGYDTTGNPGGEYKVWVSTVSTFDNNQTKTDNFKVRNNEWPPQAAISGVKFEDANGNGLFDPEESGLEGWTINISYTDGSGTHTATTTTGSLGIWSWFLPEGASAITVCEVQQPGWGQTAPKEGSKNTSETATANGDKCWVIDLLGSTPVTGLDFGNFQAQDLTVSKTANPAFTRTYLWSIKKSVDKTLVKVLSGSVDFNYMVEVNQTGISDSDWALAGTITIVNPNPWPITLTGVTDAVDNGGVCTTAPTDVVVPAKGSLEVPYTCSYQSAPLDGQNTATVTWDKVAALTPSDTASGTANFTFSTPTTRINQTVNVTDSLAGDLGQVTATDSAPFAQKTFTYTLTLASPPYGCIDYVNTATIVETEQSASQTVTICRVPPKTGALTMGFWQNKNGQFIITSSTTLRDWLRGFAPFQNLSVTATPTQVATYVYNVIKAANASGTSMNAMLKGQMLATALDVYFSDPALGGNKINAPQPIGGVVIDLTVIPKTIGGSVYQDVSAAFGGATSLSVSQMLTYAASQSNAGGILWYGNDKGIQELAKNAFDAINNQVAFGL